MECSKKWTYILQRRLQITGWTNQLSFPICGTELWSVVAASLTNKTTAIIINTTTMPQVSTSLITFKLVMHPPTHTITTRIPSMCLSLVSLRPTTKEDKCLCQSQTKDLIINLYSKPTILTKIIGNKGQTLNNHIHLSLRKTFYPLSLFNYSQSLLLFK